MKAQSCTIVHLPNTSFKVKKKRTKIVQSCCWCTGCQPEVTVAGSFFLQRQAASLSPTLVAVGLNLCAGKIASCASLGASWKLISWKLVGVWKMQLSGMNARSKLYLVKIFEVTNIALSPSRVFSLTGLWWPLPILML